VAFNYRTLVVAGGIPIDIECWQKSLVKCLRGKAIAIKNREEIAFESNGIAIYIPSIIIIINTYFMGRLEFVNTIPLNRRNLWLRDKGHCMYCNTKITTEEVTFDHVIPCSRGGKTVWTNVVCSCGLCNNKKDNRTPKQAHMTLVKPPVIPRLSKKVVRNMIKKLGSITISEESWKDYWDVTLLS
jgi:hypothetical protein